jgi:hypothetical protein
VSGENKAAKVWISNAPRHKKKAHSSQAAILFFVCKQGRSKEKDWKPKPGQARPRGPEARIRAACLWQRRWWKREEEEAEEEEARQKQRETLVAKALPSNASRPRSRDKSRLSLAEKVVEEGRRRCRRKGTKAEGRRTQVTAKNLDKQGPKAQKQGWEQLVSGREVGGEEKEKRKKKRKQGRGEDRKVTARACTSSVPKPRSKDNSRGSGGCLSLSACVCLCLPVTACVCLCMSVSVCLWLPVSLPVSVCVCLWLLLSASLCLPVWLCLSVSRPLAADAFEQSPKFGLKKDSVFRACLHIPSRPFGYDQV